MVERAREIVPANKRAAYRIAARNLRNGLGLVKVDQRTKEARLLRETRAALIGHVGGNPSVVERALIERAVWQTLRVAQYDAMVVAGDTLSEDENRTHLAWVNSLSRTLDRTQVIPFVIRQNDDCACERPPLFIAEQLPDPLIFGRDPGQCYYL